MRGSPIQNMQTSDGLVIKHKSHAPLHRVPGANQLSTINGKNYMRMSISEATKHTGSSALSETYYSKLMGSTRDPHGTYDVYVPV